MVCTAGKGRDPGEACGLDCAARTRQHGPCHGLRHPVQPDCGGRARIAQPHRPHRHRHRPRPGARRDRPARRLSRGTRQGRGSDDRDRAPQRASDQHRCADPGERPRRGQPRGPRALGGGGGGRRLSSRRPARPHRPPAALGARFGAARRVRAARGALLEHRAPVRRGRDPGRRRGLCRERGATEARWLQRRRAARSPRLSDRAVPLARVQRPHGRLWRALRGTHALSARGVGGGPRRLRRRLHRRHQAAVRRAGAGRNRSGRGGAHRPCRGGRRRARLSFLQPGRIRSRIRHSSAGHALPAAALPGAAQAAPRGRRRAAGDRPRPDRFGRGGGGGARRGRLRPGRPQPPADIGRGLAA